MTFARAVCEEEVQPPSALGNRHLRDDLDIIVLKAMQKEPGRCCASVVEFSEDLHRHLEGLPIAARADTLVYRVTGFVRRNRIGLAAAAAAVAALEAGLGVSLYEARICAAALRSGARAGEYVFVPILRPDDAARGIGGSAQIDCRHGAQIPGRHC